MKKFTRLKFIRLAAVIVLLVATVAGCGKKVLRTAKEFVTMAEADGYIVTDCSEQYSAYPEFLEVQVAQESNYNFQMEFYVFSDEDSASIVYDANKDDMASAVENSHKYTHSENTLVHQAYYSGTANGTYYYLCRNENTMFYAVVSEEYKSEVKSFLKTFGY